MLAEQDFSKMQDYICQQLPQLLRHNPEIATTIEGILAHQFPRRDEFTQLLNEIKLLREDTNRRFEQIEQRIEQVEQRIEQVEQRIEQVEQRIEQVEQRIEQVEQRIELLQEEVNQLRNDMNKRFELLQAEMNKRFELLQVEMNKRFEEEKRERLDMKRDLTQVKSMVKRMDEKITQFDAWLKVVTGNVGDKKGKDTEQLFALGLGYGLKRTDIKPETIQLRQIFRDEEGIVFPKKGKSIEVDILAENGNFSVFEVKTTAIETDVVTFARKVQLIQHQMPDKQVSGIFISPEASEEVKQCCAEYDLMFVG
ncbi:hypothetical protein [Candidatus Parabeggiatoa sp. HSG14]|uniref:hypothetical protein n=1 Tax=Candidatus Parabeggiatoa sp. HSG14 TaxID=3055593 RepID=UPI0025A8B791|nr:hypothetical protein [Thiotrichales bacterium HSG14]